jgi:hypothetical protein
VGLAMSSDFADLHAVADEATSSTNGKRSNSWPKIPGHDTSLVDIQSYLTTAARLPRSWVVDRAKRHGQHGGNPLSIFIRRPGDLEDIEIRFEAQRDCSKPGTLRGAFAEATRGQCRMRYPSPAQASDFYLMVCALAEVGEVSSVAEETEAWLHEYLERAWLMPNMTLVPDSRYDALCVLQARGGFDRVKADRYVRGDLDEPDRWVAIVDTQTGELWFRAGEFATYMRKVYGVAISQNDLDARIREFGGERVRLEEDLRARGGRHIALIFYRFPSSQSFPSVIRM